MEDNDLISRKALVEAVQNVHITVHSLESPFEVIRRQGEVFRKIVDNAPAWGEDMFEKYNALRENFVDYVCSGVPNPAPYCKNRCAKCVDGRGWCTYEQGKCRGFNPDGEGRAEA